MGINVRVGGDGREVRGAIGKGRDSLQSTWDFGCSFS